MSKSFRKTLVTGLVALSVTILGCWERGHHHSPTAPPDVVIGSGRLTQEERPVSGIFGVRLIGVGDIEIRQGGSEKLVVEAEDNLLQYLMTDVVGGVLEISIDPDVSIQATRRIVYYLDVIELEQADVIGAGDLDCASLSGNRLDINAIGVGTMNFRNLDLNELAVALTGVGTVRTTGAVDTQRVSMTGVGNYEGKSLESAVAYVNVHSVGSATVRVRDRLVAHVTGPGCIYYVGNPILETSGMGNGCIRQVD